MTKLKIALDLSFPADTVTSTLVVYGGKGMGKTNLGGVLVEELTHAGLRWSVLDPMGVWWGMRHSEDGKGPGVECVILGGAHGDIPIEPTGGTVVADLVVDEGANTIIDFSRKANGQMWSKGEKIRFVTDYTLRLFQRQGELVEGRRREPILQVLDEAARYIPQIIPAGNADLAKSVGAWEQVVEEGRNIGLGVAFLTQRSARISKSVAELADAMIAFRTIGPNSLDAIMDWLGEHVEKSKVRELAARVRELEIGHALVVSPGWIKVEKVVQIRKRQTFDSSATPKPGQRAQRVSGQAAKPDLAKYRERMAATIEKAKAEDPKALIAEIRRLNAELAKKAATVVTPASPSKEDLVNFREQARREGYAAGLRAVQPIADRLNSLATATTETIEAFQQDLHRLLAKEPPQRGWREGFTAMRESEEKLKGAKMTTTPAAAAAGVSRPQQKILDGLAWLKGLGIDRADRVRAAMLADQSPRSSGYEKNVSTLKTAGLIDYPSSGELALTPAGEAQAAAPDVPATNDALHEAIRHHISGPQWKLLEVLIGVHPKALTREELAQRAEASALSSGFEKNVSTLRSLGFIDYPAQGQVVALPVLFLS